MTVMDALREARLGLYISIPFCRSKCTYCNFASGVYPASEHARYVARVIEDLADARERATHSDVVLPRTVDTIFFGGGTPSLLEPELMTQLFEALRTSFDVEPDAEITVECAPGQIADGTLAAMQEAGVNRVSLGVQSFIDREAQASGRLHGRLIVEEDLRRLREAGIGNLNVDLIAGLAGQTFASWEKSLDALIDCGVPHASIYMFEVDTDSRLGREMLAGGVRYSAGLVPTDEAMAEMYTHAIERLAEAGLEQYEISNFSRPGRQSQHNLRYWQRRPYLGLGLDASSALRGGRDGSRGVLRSTTTSDLNAFLEAPTEPVETTWLSPELEHEEAWFLGLRLNRGVDVGAMEREFGAELTGLARRVVAGLVEEGLLTHDAETVRLTARGRLLSNEVFRQFLELRSEASESAKRSSAETLVFL
jgi:oxygen-independent coproporphyrinogen-3 oxidase